MGADVGSTTSPFPYTLVAQLSSTRRDGPVARAADNPLLRVLSADAGARVRLIDEGRSAFVVVFFERAISRQQRLIGIDPQSTTFHAQILRPPPCLNLLVCAGKRLEIDFLPSFIGSCTNSSHTRYGDLGKFRLNHLKWLSARLE